MLVTLYTVRVVLNVLGEIDYGVYNVVCGFVAMFGVLNTTLSSATSRFYNYEIGQHGRSGATRVYNTSLVVQVVLAIAVFLLVEAVGLWYIHNKMVIPPDRLIVAKCIFQFSVVSLVLHVMLTPYSASVIAFEKMDFLAVVGILDAMLKLGIVFLLKHVQADKLLLYGILMMLISIINFLMYFIFCKMKFKELKIKKGFDKSLIKPMLSFSGWMLLDPFAYMLKGQGSNMALNFYHGPIMNTAYGISNQVASALESFSGNISTAFRPQIIQSYSEGNYSRTKNLMYSMSKIIFILKLLLCIPVVLEADYLLHLWLGDGFPEIAIRFSQMMVIIGVTNSFAHPITVVISAKGNMKRYMIFTSIVVSAVLPISILLMMFGVEPICVYWTMLVSAILNLVVSISILTKEFEQVTIKDYILSVLLPSLFHTIVALSLPILVWWLLPSSLLRLVLVSIAAGFSTLIASYFIALNNKEKEMMKNFFITFIKRFNIKKKSI